MAIYIYCPHCHTRLEGMHQECIHCERELPPGVLYALTAAQGGSVSSAPHQPSQRLPPHVARPAAYSTASTNAGSPTPTHHSALRPWLAAALSLICGLGQLYNGQRLKGGILLLLGGIAAWGWQFPAGKVGACCLWLYAMLDAYLVARRSSPTVL